MLKKARYLRILLGSIKVPSVTVSRNMIIFLIFFFSFFRCPEKIMMVDPTRYMKFQDF